MSTIDDRIIFYLTNEKPLSRLHTELQTIEGYKINVYHLRAKLEKMVEAGSLNKYSKDQFVTFQRK